MAPRRRPTAFRSAFHRIIHKMAKSLKNNSFFKKSEQTVPGFKKNKYLCSPKFV